MKIEIKITDEAGNVQQYVVSGSLPTDEDISKKAQEARVDDINDSINLTYPNAFDKYINNKSVIGRYYDRPLINRYDKWVPYYAYVEGIKFENGYVWASHGGGCSGEDCNQTFIISPDNKLVAGFDW